MSTKSISGNSGTSCAWDGGDVRRDCESDPINSNNILTRVKRVDFSLRLPGTWGSFAARETHSTRPTFVDSRTFPFSYSTHRVGSRCTSPHHNRHYVHAMLLRIRYAVPGPLFAHRSIVHHLPYATKDLSYTDAISHTMCVHGLKTAEPFAVQLSLSVHRSRPIVRERPKQPRRVVASGKRSSFASTIRF